MKIKKRYKNSRNSLKNKKAQEATLVFYYAVCALMALFVTYIFMKIVYFGAKDSSFNMQYFANDIGTVMDAMYSVPGDVSYDYRKDPSKFIVEFKDTGVFVYTPIRLVQNQEAIYGYMASPEKKFASIFLYPVVLSFRKTGSYVEVTETGTYKGISGCPEIPTAGILKDKLIAIDPGHYSSDPGLKNENLEEQMITKQIADSIGVLCQVKNVKCYILKQAGMTDKSRELSQLKPDMIISLHIGDYIKPESNPVSATVLEGSDQSRKLSCLIKTELGKINMAILDDSIIDQKYIRSSDYDALLRTDTPSVMLVLSNIRNKAFIGQNSNINKIADSILKGIGNYYSQAKAK